MTAGIDLCLGKIHEPPPESSGRGFLFDSRGFMPEPDFQGLLGRFLSACRFL